MFSGEDEPPTKLKRTCLKSMSPIEEIGYRRPARCKKVPAQACPKVHFHLNRQSTFYSSSSSRCTAAPFYVNFWTTLKIFRLNVPNKMSCLWYKPLQITRIGSVMRLTFPMNKSTLRAGPFRIGIRKMYLEAVRHLFMVLWLEIKH